MTAPWRKAVRDFWQERTRTVLVVLAIAVGIAGFAAVLASYAILTRELDRGYLRDEPAPRRRCGRTPSTTSSCGRFAAGRASATRRRGGS